VKPIRLVLAAFGPFAGREEIDFQSLVSHGLYVVAGPTGTGKTTIFDAMAYALYGSLPGERPIESVRSQHAEASEPTLVEFEFEMEGRLWRVRRSPAWSRPRRRGAGLTSEPARATLEEMVDGRWEGRESGVTKVAPRCEGILGLGPDHFQRVVLLPQGKFQQFLVSDTRSRRELLSRVFGTSLFARAVDRLRLVAGEARQEVDRVGSDVEYALQTARTSLAAIEGALAPAVSGRDPLAESAPDHSGDEEIAAAPTAPEIEACLDGLEGAIEAERKDADARSRAAGEAGSRAGAAKDVVRRWDQRAALRELEATLLSRREEMRSRERAVADAERAVPVADAHRASEQAGRDLEVARLARDEASRSFRLHAEGIGIPENVDESPGEARARIAAEESRLRLRREVLQGLLQATADETRAGQLSEQASRTLEERLVEQGRIVARLAALDAEKEALRPVASTLVERVQIREDMRRRSAAVASRIEVLGRLDAALATAELCAKQATKALRDYLAGTASALAAELSQGEPCPVCGSREHPSPAATDTVAPGGDREAVEQARQAAADARTLVDSAAGELRTLERELGSDVETSLEEAVARHREAHLAAVAAEQADAQLRRVDAEQGRLRSEQEAVGVAVAAASSEVASARERHAAAREALAKSRQQAAGDDPARLDAVEASLARALEAVATWDEAAATLRDAEAVLVERRAALARAVESGAWPDVSAALAVEMPPERLAEERRQVDEFDLQVTHVSAQILTIEEQPPPVDRPDVGALEAEAERLRVEASEAALRVGTIEAEMRRAREALADGSRSPPPAATGPPGRTSPRTCAPSAPFRWRCARRATARCRGCWRCAARC